MCVVFDTYVRVVFDTTCLLETETLDLKSPKFSFVDDGDPTLRAFFLLSYSIQSEGL